LYYATKLTRKDVTVHVIVVQMGFWRNEKYQKGQISMVDGAN
jgi:hypothetical protein